MPGNPLTATPPIEPFSPIQNPVLSAQANAAQLDQIKQAKIKSSMIHSGGSSGGGQANSTNPNDRPWKRTSGDDFNIQASSAAHVNVTKAGDMKLLIVQGKIIEAVLETPINTNYPGPIRAVISKDVYSEKGENILIPSGSRVIGNINGAFSAGQDKVIIQWNRVILPNGYDISMNSPGSDNLGNIGVQGSLHREFFNSIGNSLLLSAINISFAKILQDSFNIAGSQQTTTTDPTSGTQTQTTSLSPTQQAAQQGITSLGDTTAQWMKDNYATKPYVTINQGTILKIFVNQDIIFPENLATGVKVLQ